MWLASQVECTRATITQILSEDPEAIWASTLAVPISQVLEIPGPAFEDAAEADAIAKLLRLRATRPEAFAATMRLVERYLAEKRGRE